MFFVFLICFYINLKDKQILLSLPLIDSEVPTIFKHLNVSIYVTYCRNSVVDYFYKRYIFVSFK